MTKTKDYPENASHRHPSLDELTEWLDSKIETALNYSLEFSSESEPPGFRELIFLSSLINHILLLKQLLETINDDALGERCSMLAMEDLILEFNMA